MTRERRVEANARERSRVHTVSAAFENLRRAVPSYSYNQRLSKLAILRIASCYITALSRLADLDYSADQSRPSFADCVDSCTRTIQAEGKAKRRH
jgi:atonal protein 8